MGKALGPLVVFFSLLLLAGCETGPRSGSEAERGGPAADAAFSDLVDLVEERLELMYAVAQTKWQYELPAEDYAREEELLALVIEEGGRRGMQRSMVESFFIVQIEAGLQLQEHYLSIWNESENVEFENVRDLEEELRPELDRIALAMVDRLARVYTAPPSEERAWERLIASRERLVDARGIPADVVDIALSPFTM